MAGWVVWGGWGLAQVAPPLGGWAGVGLRGGAQPQVGGWRASRRGQRLGCSSTNAAPLLQACVDPWVKVKGHSKEEGNDAADTLAGYAQNGGEKNVQDIAMMMDLLRSDG